MTINDTTMNTDVYIVGLRNNTLNAMAVPISVKNVDAIKSLPTCVFDRPVSTSTEYTTASEVVDNAVPAIRDADMAQPAIKYVNRKTPMNGAKNDMAPIRKDSLNFSRISSVSISVPARNVRRMPAKLAIKVIHSLVRINPRLLARAPITNSIIATDRPNFKEIKLAIRIKAPIISGIISACITYLHYLVGVISYSSNIKVDSITFIVLYYSMNT